MSDISGPPIPKPIEPVSKTTARTGTVSKDPNQSGTQARNDQGDTSAKNNQSEAAHGREPAVSISASAAHLEVGEELEEKVKKLDNEGRPIIVTETATFALRPDAGLRPGDEVKLEIIEAGKKVSADLFELNGRPIHPPIQLSLIVIAVHGPDASQPAAKASDQAPLPPSTPAAHYSAAQVSHTAPPDEAAMASLLAAKSATTPAPIAPTTIQPAASPESGAKTAPAPAALETFRTVTHNPDPVSGRSSSSDLATLIAQQQGADPAPRAFRPDAAARQPVPTPQANAHHLLPENELTKAIAATGDNASSIGLGPKVDAFATGGQAQTLQLVDPSVSSVPPAQLADVIQVRPLPPDEARNLPLPLSAFANPAAALAIVDTSKGSFVAPLAETAAWTGEQVKVSTPVADTPPPQRQAAPLVSYKGQLADAGGAARHPVAIAVPGEGAETSGADVRVKAVHTVRAFLSNDGPRTDLRLETPRGDVFVTLPNQVRPAAGDIIQILPLTSPEVVPVTSVPAEAVANAVATATAGGFAASTALSSPTAHSWTALEQTAAIAVASDPAVAAQISAKGAEGGGKLTNSLLFFLAAAGRTNPSQWLGAEAERLLASREPSVLDVLKGDIAQMMTLATDGVGEWRSMVLPFDTRGGDVSLIALLLGQPHRPVDEDGGGQSPGQDADDGDEGQRFVLEVQFSVLGPVQLDGLIKGRQFDLALRSLLPLPEGLRRDTRQLFADALAANGYTGGLHISHGEAFPIDVDKIIQDGLAAQQSLPA